MRKNKNKPSLKPVYATNGEWVALLAGNHIYDTTGEWMGWFEGQDVYTRDGEYAGYLSDDSRILRERIKKQRPLKNAPPAPPNVRPPVNVPLAPMFAELPWNIVDVFDEDPYLFRHISELRPDWED